MFFGMLPCMKRPKMNTVNFIYSKCKAQVDTLQTTLSLGRAVQDRQDSKRDAVMESQKVEQRLIINS